MRQLCFLTIASAVALVWVLAAFGGVQEAEARARPSTHDRIVDLRQELASMREDVEDLKEPVEEFDLFDQCMFTIGVTQHGTLGGESGYHYGEGGQERRPALAMDMRGFGTPQYDFLAFPGEEPPQIECNEDAAGQGTNE
jgi:hypothetical protein